MRNGRVLKMMMMMKRRENNKSRIIQGYCNRIESHVARHTREMKRETKVHSHWVYMYICMYSVYIKVEYYTHRSGPG